MLNEIKEYKEYITPSSNRLKFQNLLKGGKYADLNGLSRALIIIARQFLWNDQNKPDIQQAENAMEAFLSLPEPGDEPNNVNDEIKHRFYNYLRDNYKNMTEAQKKKCDSLIAPTDDQQQEDDLLNGNDSPTDDQQQKDDLLNGNDSPTDDQQQKGESSNGNDTPDPYLPKLVKRYQESLYNANMDPKQFDTNDYKKNSFQKILANAWQMGPLKEYVLLCKNKEILNNIKKATPSKPDNKINEKDLDKILKTIAAILLSKHYYEKNFEVQKNLYFELSLTDLSNWVPSISRYDKFNYQVYKLNNEDLFFGNKITTDIIPVKKIGVNGTILDTFKICEKNDENAIMEYVKNNPHAAVYQDCGCQESLIDIANENRDNSSTCQED